MCVPTGKKRKKKAKKQSSGTESRQRVVEIEDDRPGNDEIEISISQGKHGNSEASCSASEEPTRLKVKAFHRDADRTQKIWHDDLTVTAAGGQSYDGTSDGQPIDVAPDTYTVTLAFPGANPDNLLLPKPKSVDVAREATVTVELELKRERTVTFEVIEDGTNQRIKDVTLEIKVPGKKLTSVQSPGTGENPLVRRTKEAGKCKITEMSHDDVWEVVEFSSA